jgi:hypothetical protein
MTTSNGSDNPLYPFNWLDAMRATVWDPPNLPLFGDDAVRNGWDRFPPASSASTRSPDLASAAAGSASAANISPNGGALAAPDVPLDGPRAAPSSWDSFPLAQPTTEVLAHSPLVSANSTAAAPALPRSFTLDQPSVAADIAKAVPVKLAQGTLGLVGSAGDTRQFGNAIIDEAGDYLGAPDWLKAGLKGANDIVSLIGNPGSIMTSADLQNKAEQVTGPFYEPKTLPGKVLGTIASFVPAAIGGEGSILPRMIKQAVLPGLRVKWQGSSPMTQ